VRSSGNNFINALQATLRREGRFVDHQADRGGPTDYGISLRLLQNLPDLAGDIDGNGHVDLNDVKAMTAADAAAFYRKYFWDHYRLEDVAPPLVAAKLFDMFVHMRGKLAAKCAQRALRACNKPVLEDGILGSKTIAAINEIRDQLNLLAALRSESWGTYALIIAQDPTQEEFRDGWKNRAYS
jgi:lysozyme family protein